MIKHKLAFSGIRWLPLFLFMIVTFPVSLHAQSVTEPNSSTTWAQGQQQVHIRWAPGTASGSVLIELEQGTASTTTIVASTANDGIYDDWNVPTTMPVALYRVRVKFLASGYGATYSDYFSIVAGSGTFSTLSNNVTVSGLSGSTGAQLKFKFTVPSGATSATFQMSGGTGDADMHVKYGQMPTTSVYDYRPYVGGNNETVTVTNPTAGDWYIMLNGYTAFSDVSLKASCGITDTQLPVVSIAAPTSGSTVSGSVTITATASDNVGVTKVVFAVNGGNLGEDASAPYSYAWNTTGTANGSATVSATAYDAAGNTKTASVTVTVNNSSPLVILTNNVAVTGLSGAQGNTDRKFKFTVPSGATSATFQMSGGTGDADMHVKYGQMPTTSVYDYRPYVGGNNETVTVTNPTAGDWYIMLNGYTAFSDVSLKASCGITDTQLPVVSIAAPTSGSTVSGSVTITATASDNVGVTKVVFAVNGGNLGEDASAPYSYAWNTTGTANGSATVSATAYDAAGNTKTASVTVTVNNSSPLVILTNNVAVTGLSGAQGNTDRKFKFTVPSGATSATFQMSGGTGDADMHVKYGQMPTTSVYDYRPYVGGNNETVTVTNPTAGDWYIMLNGYTAFSDVSLKASCGITDTQLPVVSIAAPTSGSTVSGSVTITATASDNVGVTKVVFAVNGGNLGEDASAPYSYAWNTTGTANGSATVSATAYDAAGNTKTASVTVTVNNSSPLVILTNNVAVTGLSGAQGNTDRKFKFTVPSGATSATFQMSGGTGDADMHVKYGQMPTTSVYDYRPYIGGNNETVTVTNPTAGDWYIMLNGYTAFSDVSLKASYIPGTTLTADVYEADNSRDAAQNIGAGQTQNHTIYPAGDQDWILFTAPAVGSYTLTFSQQTTALSGEVWVQMGLLPAVKLSTIASATPGADVALLTPTQIGVKYYIGVWSPTTVTGEYTITLTQNGGVVILTNNVAVTGLSGAQGNTDRKFKFTVPSGATSATFQMSGGTGDADMHVKYGQMPTTSVYDYRPYIGGNNETVTVTNPTAGDWYIMLNGYTAFSDVSLKASYIPGTTLTADVYEADNSRDAAQNIGAGQTQNHTIYPAGDQDWILFTAPAVGSYTLTFSQQTTALSGEVWVQMGLLPAVKLSTIASATPGADVALLTPTQIGVKYYIGVWSPTTVTGEYTITLTQNGGVVILTNNVAVTGLSGAQGNTDRKFKFTVPSGATSATFQMSGGTGDADMHVKYGQMPTTSVYDYRPYIGGNNETVTVTNPTAGDWYIMLNGYTAFSDVSLKAIYSTPGGSTASAGFARTFGLTGGGVSESDFKVAVDVPSKKDGAHVISDDPLAQLIYRGKDYINILATLQPQSKDELSHAGSRNVLSPDPLLSHPLEGKPIHLLRVENRDGQAKLVWESNTVLTHFSGFNVYRWNEQKWTLIAEGLKEHTYALKAENATHDVLFGISSKAGLSESDICPIALPALLAPVVTKSVSGPSAAQIDWNMIYSHTFVAFCVYEQVAGEWQSVVESQLDTVYRFKSAVKGRTFAVSAIYCQGESQRTVLRFGNDTEEQSPSNYTLAQNYPNPFNPTTTIQYDLPNRSRVTLQVFNMIGQKVAELVNGEVEAGYHEVKFDGTDIASGVYFVRMRAGTFVDTRKILLTK